MSAEPLTIEAPELWPTDAVYRAERIIGNKLTRYTHAVRVGIVALHPITGKRKRVFGSVSVLLVSRVYEAHYERGLSSRDETALVAMLCTARCLCDRVNRANGHAHHAL